MGDPQEDRDADPASHGPGEVGDEGDRCSCATVEFRPPAGGHQERPGSNGSASYSWNLGDRGDGNFHVAYLWKQSDPGQVAKVKETFNRMVDRAIEMEGTCTGEHGVGTLNKSHLIKELGSPAIELMSSLKSAWDPYWLLNPGKIFDFPV